METGSHVTASATTFPTDCESDGPNPACALSTGGDLHRDASNSGVRRVSVDRDQGHDRVVAGGELSVQIYLKRHFIVQCGDAREHDAALVVDDDVPALRCRPLQDIARNGLHRRPLDAVAPCKFDDRLDVTGQPDPHLFSARRW